MKIMQRTLALLLLATTYLATAPSLIRAADAPVLRVFILAGQSNMEGHGIVEADPKRNEGKGSLAWLVENPATASKFKHLKNEDGSWKSRDDVKIVYLDRSGQLTVGYGARQEMIGPELGFGWMMGETFDDPVLLIKCAWGGKSLAVDFRPPSSGDFPYPVNEKIQESINSGSGMVGKYYREILTLTEKTLADVKSIAPECDGRYKIEGFAWHQGWNDRIDEKFNGEYEKNLANLIRDLRKDLKVKDLPVAIAETGMNGLEEKHPRALSLMKAQAAVAEQEEFKGTVAFVKTQSFWRDAKDSPTSQGYHWNSNAETYYLIGDGLGAAMKSLLKKSP